MNDRTKNILVIILLLFVELVITAGLFYIGMHTLAWNGGLPWVYELLRISSFVFGAVLFGLTIGYLSSQEDVWKLTIGAMVFTTIACNILLLDLIQNPDPNVGPHILIQCIAYACNTIIFLVTYFVLKNRLRGLELNNRPELTDDELTLLESIAS